MAHKLAKILFLDIENVKKYRPLEINFDAQRVSFDKGCFRWQEIVARMKYLGVDRRKFSTLITKNTYEAKLCFKDLDYAEYVNNELEQKINLQKQNRNQSKYGAFATMKNRKLSDADSIYYSVPGIYYLRIINDWKRKGSQMIVFKIVVED